MNRTLLLSLLLLPAAARAADEGVSAGQFLRVSADPRAAAVGEASAAAGGARALLANPAGLRAVASPELFLSHARWIGETGLSSLAFAGKAGGGAFGVAASYLGAPATDMYDKNGSPLNDTYTAGDLAVTLGFCPKRDAPLAFGAALKYVRSSIDDQTAASAAADLGLAWGSGRTRFGAAVLNAGGKLDYGGGSDPLPLTLRAGFSHTMPLTRGRNARSDLSFFADAASLKDAGASFGGGAEYLAAYDKDYLFALRAGWKTAANGDGAGLTGGAGLVAAAYDVDYAFAPLGELGVAHRFSVTLKFAGFRRGAKVYRK